MTPIPVPSPQRAVTTGRPIASSDPKLSSRTTTAAASPTIMLEPTAVRCDCSIAGPPSSTWSAGERAVSAVEISSTCRCVRHPAFRPLDDDGREADRSVARDRRRSRRVRVAHGGDVRQQRDAVEHHVHAVPENGVGERSCPRVEDDLVTVAGLLREPALEQITRLLRPGTGEVEVARIAAAHAAPDADPGREDDHPERHDQTPVRSRQARKREHQGQGTALPQGR